MTIEQRITQLEDRMNRLERSDRYLFQKNIQMMDGRTIQVGLGTGTTIGTSTSQKLSFYGVTPIVQTGAITAPSGGGTVDSQARTAITSIINALKNMGITA
jgi:hypothetical protein